MNKRWFDDYKTEGILLTITAKTSTTQSEKLTPNLDAKHAFMRQNDRDLAISHSRICIVA